MGTGGANVSVRNSKAGLYCELRADVGNIIRRKKSAFFFKIEKMKLPL